MRRGVAPKCGELNLRRLQIRKVPGKLFAKSAIHPSFCIEECEEEYASRVEVSRLSFQRCM